MLSASERHAIDLDLFEPAVAEDVDDDDDDSGVEGVIADAVKYARFGLRVFPVIRSSDKAKDKRPPYGFKWKLRSSDRISDVVQEFAAAVQDHGADFVAVAWALGLDGYCAVDDDNGLPAELGELLEVPHAVNVTKRGCHRIYKQPADVCPGNSTKGFPVEGWGEFRGAGGYIVISGADRPGLDLDELGDVAEFPRPDWLRGAGETVAAATDQAVADFLDAHTEHLRPRALDIVIDALDDEAGSRHESLKHGLPWAMRDARAGLYAAADAVERLQEWFATATNDDPMRIQTPEFAGLVSWAVACALAENVDAIAKRRQRALSGPDGSPPAHRRRRTTRQRRRNVARTAPTRPTAKRTDLLSRRLTNFEAD